MIHSIRSCLAGLLAICALPVFAQTLPSSGADKMAAFRQQQALLQKSPFSQVRWRNAGPDNISGRCTEVAGVSGKRNIMYAAFATGGFWKTTNGGDSWAPLFDAQGTQSIGSFALAPSNPQVIYLGTGEANIFRASLTGMGMYKSIDGGQTWTHIGLEQTATIARIAVHPQNPDIVYVAAGGNEWSYNPDRGVYRTLDGGKTWQKVLGNDDHTGAIDLVMDPSDPNTLLASTWNRIRRRWSDPVPEDGDHIYKTTDGGKTWTVSDNGLPQTKFTGRIGLHFSRSNPNVVYASVDNHSPKRDPKPGELDPYGRPIQVIPFGLQVWRSDDKGSNWRKVSTEDDKLERFAGTYGWVFGQIRVDPNDENTVYILGVPMAKSTDGGKTFSVMRAEDKASDRTHGDHHALWIDPADSRYIINGNDGGVVVTYNGGRRWYNHFRKIPTTQFYNITYDMKTPFNVVGSVQDEGSFMGPSTHTYDGSGKGTQAWTDVPGGEGTIIAMDPSNPDIMYASSFYGRLMRSDLSKKDSTRTRDIYPRKADGEDVHRGEWLAYTMLSPHDPRTVYHGFQYLFRSTDEGKTWTRISGDLTYNNPEKMGRTPYAINHQAITAMDESPLMKGLLYVGTDDGRVWVRQGEGAEWTPVMKGIPQNAHVSRLVASAYEPATVYLTLSNRREDDQKVYMYRSRDNGANWEDISGNLPAAPANVIREDPKNRQILYCGTDIGVYVSRDGGKQWLALQGNLPVSVSVQDLFVHPRDNKLVIATYGRGVWVLDDLSQIQQ
jgi:photosystem II stability/assembly factor-like uncharacterized protein